jgi:hypothetical protein
MKSGDIAASCWIAVGCSGAADTIPAGSETPVASASKQLVSRNVRACSNILVLSSAVAVSSFPIVAGSSDAKCAPASLWQGPARFRCRLFDSALLDLLLDHLIDA